jgi:glutathione S-transferase
MTTTLYFAPGACSFVPHVGLELVKAATGADFEPKLIKLHKGEHLTPEYLALNPNGQVPVLVENGRALTQIVAICDYLAAKHPQARLLPTDPWQRAQALSLLAWFNNTIHPTFTRVFKPGSVTDDEGAQAKVRAAAVGQYRELLERLQARVEGAAPFLGGAAPSFADAYALTLLRWGGYAGIDPASLPKLQAYVARVAAHPAVAAAMQRERIDLNTYQPVAA